MGLNIKSAEAHRLVAELAKLTGESMTAAVTEAVRERLERIKRERGPRLADRLLAIGMDCAGRLKEPYRPATMPIYCTTNAGYHDDRRHVSSDRHSSLRTRC